jgi:hypothetical protein
LDRLAAEAIACDARMLNPGKPNRAEIPPDRRRAALARDVHLVRSGWSRLH